MANTKISGLTASASNIAATDVLPVVQTTGVGPVKMSGLQLAGGLLGSTSLSGSTVTTSQPVLNLSQTWNAGAVTFTGLKFNATDTASAAASLVLDLQVGGSSLFTIRKDGYVTASSIYCTSLWGPAGSTASLTSNGFAIGSSLSLLFSNDLFLRRAAAATLQLGAADAAAPVAQTLQVQSVVAGTSNTAGTNFTIKGSAGTGTGAGGSIIFQVAPAGTAGTAQNAYATALTIDSTKLATFGGSISLPAASGLNVGASNVFTVDTLAGIRMYPISDGSVSLGATTRGWSSVYIASAGALAFNNDTFLYRDAANTLALRNSTSAQTFNVYNTYTDASNYERAALTWSSNVAYLRAQNAGTGSARLMVPVTGSTTVASLPSASTAGAGARSFVTDANATSFLSTVAGGGANKVPVVSDGTSWLIG